MPVQTAELREYHQVAENASSTAMKSPVVPQTYEVNDRVCRLLPDRANKLSYRTCTLAHTELKKCCQMGGTD